MCLHLGEKGERGEDGRNGAPGIQVSFYCWSVQVFFCQLLAATAYTR